MGQFEIKASSDINQLSIFGGADLTLSLLLWFVPCWACWAWQSQAGKWLLETDVLDLLSSGYGSEVGRQPTFNPMPTLGSTIWNLKCRCLGRLGRLGRLGPYDFNSGSKNGAVYMRLHNHTFAPWKVTQNAAGTRATMVLVPTTSSVQSCCFFALSFF
jgi:hypothetical protein